MHYFRKAVTACAVFAVVFGSLFVSWASEEIRMTNNEVKVYQKQVMGYQISLLEAEAQGLQKEGFEKILTPEQIKYYQNIRKIDTSLWGIRKEANSAMDNQGRAIRCGADGTRCMETTKDESTSTTSEQARLEKILTPEQIKYYQNIRKIESSLWGIKKESNEKVEVKTTKTERKPAVKVDAAIADCVKSVIDKKDTGLKAAFNAQNSAIITAIDARTSCQKAALDQTSAESQQAANKLCITTYQTSTKATLLTLSRAKEANWKTFSTDLKACRTNSTTSSSDPITIEDGETAFTLTPSLIAE